MSLNPPVNASSPAARAVSLPKRVWRIALWLVLLLWSLAVLAWLALHWVILPHIQQWRPEIEARASKALGLSVNIGHIEVRSSGWVPSLELRDVALRDARGDAALTLPRIYVALSPHSLLAWEPRLAQLLIEGAHVEARRDATGRIFVAGIDLGGGDSEDTAVADWLFKQREIVIRGASLRWTDALRNASALELTDVQWVMRNGLRAHNMRLDATPPPDWGDRFTVQGKFTQSLLARAADWQHWSGRLHADLPRADLHQLRQHVALPFELSEGIGGLRAWLDLRNGQAEDGTVDVALRAVSLRLAPNLAPLTLAQLEGRITGRRTDAGLKLALKNFGFLSGDGTRWPRGDMNLVLRQVAGQPSHGGEFSAQQLDLDVMAQVAASLPLGSALRKLVAEVNPKGAVRELAVRWVGPLDAPDQYMVNGVLSGLNLSSKASGQAQAVGRPGVRNADVLLNAHQGGGSATLSLNHGALELPGVFEDPLLPLDRLTARLTWTIQDRAVTVKLVESRFANRDAKGELTGVWRTGAGADALARGGRFPGQIELNGRLTDALAPRLARYLPLHIPERTRRYVERAVQGGTLTGVDVRVKGDLWDFPFFDPARSGDFRLAAQAKDVSFAYVPSVPASASEPAYDSPWPALTRLSGELVLDRSSLSLLNAQAWMADTHWTGLHGGMANFVEHGLLQLQGTGRGELAEMLRVVNTTPVSRWISRSLAQARATGPAEMKLALSIPLDELAATKVQGSVSLPGNDVRITPLTPWLAGAKGRVDFSHQGFAVVGATARTYGGEVKFEGGSQPDGQIRFNGQGHTTAQALAQAPELGLLSRLAPFLDGQAAYRMELGFVQGVAEMDISSNLVGLASRLPEPLAKAADESLALRYRTRIDRASLQPGAGADRGLRDSLQVDLGNRLAVRYERDLSGEFARVLRGGIGILTPPRPPKSGVTVDAALTRVNLDAWRAVQDRVFDAPASGDDGASGSYGPTNVTVRADELQFLSRKLNHVVAGITLDQGKWRATLDADQLDGYVEYQPPRLGATPEATVPGRVFARLSRLSLPPSEVQEVENLLDEHTPTVPALDIVVNDFELRGKRLGRLEIDASNRLLTQAGQTRREWRLAKFNLLTPEARLTATGRWSAGGQGASARRLAEMDFQLALADSGAYLERLGMGQVVLGGKGLIAGQLAWNGSPLTIDYGSLSGRATVDVEAGQFLRADAGAARLLSVLSLQSLTRRLTLDFRDVFDAGFAFDSFAGHVNVDKGVAYTNNLRMRGAQAAALMEGQADLARETQDLRVVVVPEIDAGTASLAYAIINPAVGLGTFLAQLFLRKPFSEAGTREFQVSGPWGDPKVERVERRANVVTPAAGPADATTAVGTKPAAAESNTEIEAQAPTLPPTPRTPVTQ